MRRGLLLAALLLFAASSSCTRTPEQRAYVEALMRSRTEKDRFLQSSESPIAPETRPRFKGLSYYPPNFDLVFTLSLQPPAQADTLQFPTSHDTFDPYRRKGVFRFQHGGREHQLTLFEALDGTHLFLPFTDATSGAETYGAGRYLDPEPLGPGQLRLDFNRAYNPYCAYSPHWICPVAPPENRLDFAVKAGERNFPLAAH